MLRAAGRVTRKGQREGVEGAVPAWARPLGGSLDRFLLGTSRLWLALSFSCFPALYEKGRSMLISCYRRTSTDLRAGSLGIESWPIHLLAMTFGKSLSFFGPQFTSQYEGALIVMLCFSREDHKFIEIIIVCRANSLKPPSFPCETTRKG